MKTYQLRIALYEPIARAMHMMILFETTKCFLEEGQGMTHLPYDYT